MNRHPRPDLSIVALSRLLVGLTLLLAASVHTARAEAPQDALRANIDKGIAVLKDPQYQDATRREAQRERLCAIAKEMFDPYLFSKLALGANWRAFNPAEREAFVDSFAAYLCRYYLSRLQQHYDDESVAFVEQRFKSEFIATVKLEVLWQDTRVPVEVRMVLREGRWRAYDLVFMGVSAVKVYRTQFNDALRMGTPGALIESLRKKTAADG